MSICTIPASVIIYQLSCLTISSYIYFRFLFIFFCLIQLRPYFSPCDIRSSIKKGSEYLCIIENNVVNAIINIR